MKVVQASVGALSLVLVTPTSPIVEIVLKMQVDRYSLWLSSLFYKCSVLPMVVPQ